MLLLLSLGGGGGGYDSCVCWTCFVLLPGHMGRERSIETFMGWAHMSHDKDRASEKMRHFGNLKDMFFHQSEWTPPVAGVVGGNQPDSQKNTFEAELEDSLVEAGGFWMYPLRYPFNTCWFSVWLWLKLYFRPTCKRARNLLSVKVISTFGTGWCETQEMVDMGSFPHSAC